MKAANLIFWKLQSSHFRHFRLKTDTSSRGIPAPTWSNMHQTAGKMGQWLLTAQYSSTVEQKHVIFLRSHEDLAAKYQYENPVKPL